MGCITDAYHACSPPPPPPPPHPPAPVCEAFVDIFNATGNIHNMSTEITRCCSTYVAVHLPAPAAASPPPVAALPTVWSVVLEGDGVGGAALSPPFSVHNTAYMIRLRAGDSDKQLGATLSISTTPAYVAALRCWAASDMLDSSKQDWSPRLVPRLRNGNTASFTLTPFGWGWPRPFAGLCELSLTGGGQYSFLVYQATDAPSALPSTSQPPSTIGQNSTQPAGTAPVVPAIAANISATERASQVAPGSKGGFNVLISLLAVTLSASASAMLCHQLQRWVRARERHKLLSQLGMDTAAEDATINYSAL